MTFFAGKIKLLKNFGSRKNSFGFSTQSLGLLNSVVSRNEFYADYALSCANLYIFLFYLFFSC